MRVGLETVLSTPVSVEDNSDDDFQPVVTARKRKSCIVKFDSGLQKRLKGKGKARDSAVTATSSTDISTTDQTIMFNKITLDDYDLEYSSDDFDAPVVKRLFLGESTKSTFRITKSTSAAVEPSTTASKTSLASPKPSKPVPTAFKSAAASIKSSLCPVPTDKASDIKEGPKKISKHPLYDLVHTTNLLVTHTFAFTKYIYLQELAANENFALNNFVTKDFLVEAFLSLVLSKGGNNKRLKDTTENYRRLISKYKEAYFEDAGYTPQNLSYSQQIALYQCTKIQTAYYNNIKAHFGNRLRGLINKLFKKRGKAESLGGEMQANKSSSKAIKEANRKKIYRLCNQPLRFQGTLETDGVGVSIIKQNIDTSRKLPKPNTEKKLDGNQTEHTEGLGQADLKSTEGKCVLIDPRRRDLMNCMKETSTVEEKQTLIFTKNNRSKCSRNFRYLRKRTQPFVVQKAEAILSRSESNSVDSKKFVQYIKTKASVKNTLYEYYGNETTKSKETYFL
ncbi:hypothetical protein G6F39_012312 [Rhizopus arrhizus]|nr:hypothetical protein G6F39_012312 [Rhizopus arrhizus]